MMKFHNTLSRRKQEIKTVLPGEVKMYTCGPTVYNFAHIGNFRTYMFEDLLRRCLKRNGYIVTQVMNLTDIDDKTIKGANDAGIELDDYTAPFIAAFFEDIDTLRIQRAEEYPRATRHIPEMLALIEVLETNGHTYTTEDAIYFKIKSFNGYGNLSDFDLDQVKPGTRVDADEYEKEDARDFALWKFARPGEPKWESKWGDGRPGWHIECSAMAMKYLGETFDIHTGGVDNLFPHHENEIAQSECSTGKKFANFFLHSEHLIVEGEKMSKSAGNFYTVRDIIDKGHDPLALRYLLLTNHYRRQLNFTFDGLNAATEAVNRLQAVYRRLTSEYNAPTIGVELRDHITKATVRFTAALNDDLAIADAVAAVFDLVKVANKAMDEKLLNADGVVLLIEAFRDFDLILDVIEPRAMTLDDEVESLIAERENARNTKDYARADAIRDQLIEMGIALEDTPGGVRWKRK